VISRATSVPQQFQDEFLIALWRGDKQISLNPARLQDRNSRLETVELSFHSCTCCRFDLIPAAKMPRKQVERPCRWNYIGSWRGFQSHPLILRHVAENWQTILAIWESKSERWRRTLWMSVNCTAWVGSSDQRNKADNRLPRWFRFASP
jgi:hypothetical protein